MQVVLLETRVDRHKEELVAFLARRLGNPADAEEMAQDVWVRVARAAPECPDEASFRGYLFTVARRLLIDHHRRPEKRAKFVAIDGEGAAPLPDVGRGPEDQLRAGQALQVVEATLEDLKPELAEVFRWRTTEDVSFQEIAARQGCGLNTALGRMHRATKYIAAALARAGILGNGEEP
jgi:RNA polymerase sigma factor (sigma-70 family)